MIVKDKKLADKLIEMGFGIETEEGLELSELEESYLAEQGIIEAKIKEDDRYKVYKYLRDRGYIVRETGELLRVFRKGYRRGEDRSFALVKVKKKEEMAELLEDVEKGLGAKKEMVYACIEGEEPRFLLLVKRSFQ